MWGMFSTIAEQRLPVLAARCCSGNRTGRFSGAAVAEFPERVHFSLDLDRAERDNLNTFKEGLVRDVPTTEKRITKGDLTRERIFTVALNLFREKGFEGTTMREVAAAANMSLGAAYYYFASKE